METYLYCADNADMSGMRISSRLPELDNKRPGPSRWAALCSAVWRLAPPISYLHKPRLFLPSPGLLLRVQKLCDNWPRFITLLFTWLGSCATCWRSLAKRGSRWRHPQPWCGLCCLEVSTNFRGSFHNMEGAYSHLLLVNSAYLGGHMVNKQWQWPNCHPLVSQIRMKSRPHTP